MDDTGLIWPRYNGPNGSMVAFGDDAKASHVEHVSAMNEVYPLETC